MLAKVKKTIVYDQKFATISWFDMLVIISLLIGGMFYLHDVLYWGFAYIGNAQYGDAQFWWDGALHVAQGIFKDNPGKGFRPGYFVLAGLPLPVLGSNFQQFHDYFLIVFLLASGLFYLSLRTWLGRWPAFCVIAMLVFNPFTAEWLATSTTDATGLLLHLAALTCLLRGVRGNLHTGWLIGFALFFAMASLTRPLMTPFIGLVILAILFLTNSPWKKRFYSATLILLAFCIPTLLWMAAQKIIIDQWSISTNDASAFYAASDPTLQVWSGTMYDRISHLASERYHVVVPSEKLLNQMFWIESLHNYSQFYLYHLKRIFPHIWQIASFTPKMATRGTESWRTLFLILLTAGLSIQMAFHQKWFRAFLLGLGGVAIYCYPFLVPWMTLVGAFLALFMPKREYRVGLFLLSSYWWMGIIALYFVGGTWGPPLGATYGLNALGYRLGAQFFFVGDLLAAYVLIWLAYSKSRSQLASANSLCNSWLNLYANPSRLAHKTLTISLNIFFILIAFVYIVGGSIVFQRTYQRLHASIQSYPPMDGIIAYYKKHTGGKLEQADYLDGSLDDKTRTALSNHTLKNDIVFTGNISSFIWNMQGQQRTQLLVHAQKQLYPMAMGPRFLILEIPQQISEENWINKQGAFLIREVHNGHEGFSPYYLTTPTIHAFVPLSADGKSYDLQKTQWFDIVKNATQLETSGELQSQNAAITWASDSGQEKFQRRFMLTPKVSGKAKLILDVSAAKGPSTLSFSYALESATVPSTQKYYGINVEYTPKGSTHSEWLWSSRETVVTNVQTDALKQVMLAIPNNTKTVTISFDNLLSKSNLWMYEFNLSASDFVMKTALAQRKNK